MEKVPLQPGYAARKGDLKETPVRYKMLSVLFKSHMLFVYVSKSVKQNANSHSRKIQGENEKQCLRKAFFNSLYACLQGVSIKRHAVTFVQEAGKTSHRRAPVL